MSRAKVSPVNSISLHRSTKASLDLPWVLQYYCQRRSGVLGGIVHFHGLWVNLRRIDTSPEEGIIFAERCYTLFCPPPPLLSLFNAASCASDETVKNNRRIVLRISRDREKCDSSANELTE